MKRIRVLLVDDSSSARQLLAVLLSREADLEIVGQAGDGAEAVELATSLLPDVVLMDFNMPRMNGLTATAQIMERAPARILLLTALGNDRELNLAYAAIAAGALELVSKHQGTEPLEAWAKRLVATVRIMSEVPVISRRRAAPSAAPVSASHRGAIGAMGIVASTGGPQLIARLVAELPPDLPAPVLIVQHLAPGFATSFVRWLTSLTPLRVEFATDGGQCLPGHVYLPPDGSDLELRARGVLRVLPASGTHFASGDHLLNTLAAAYGGTAGGMVLTGMGRDGAAGLLAIRRGGGLTAAQDEASSVVYGMPRAARDLNAVMHTLSADQLAAFIVSACRSERSAVP